MGNRSIVYVDGFNLYYGALRGSAHKWLDLERLFERLRPSDTIQAINYFTALVSGTIGPTRKPIFGPWPRWRRST